MVRDDGDFRAYGPPPAEYYSPFSWDGADQMLFRPMSRFWAVDDSTEAVNANAMDEVADSSWFENRLGRVGEDMTAAVMARGPCDAGATLDENAPPGSWKIVAGKPNGANPGFIIEGPTGQRFILKFDSLDQPERATTADVFGSLVYYALGYHAPCNRVVWFDRAILEVGADATVTVDGEEVPMTMEMVMPALDRAPQVDGRLRASASRFFDARPIGPWRYEGVRNDDPNDVIPHQERRELRGAYIVAAWINHFDSREQNTLSVWREPPGAAEGTGYVQHTYIDWGDSLGSEWPIDGISRRLGYSSYFDLPHVFQDFVSLGMIPRRWNKVGDPHDVWGYFRADDFDAEHYRPGYPNPAFNRATERDKAWMTRILAWLTPEMVEAALEVARMDNQDAKHTVSRILLERRERILRRWLTRLSPLTHPQISRSADEVRLCATDLAVRSGISSAETRPYWNFAYQHDEVSDDLTELGALELVRRRGDQVCATLPRAQASQDAPAYLIVDIAGVDLLEDGSPEQRALPLRVHLYRLGADDYRVVGVERPDHIGEPTGRE